MQLFGKCQISPEEPHPLVSSVPQQTAGEGRHKEKGNWSLLCGELEQRVMRKGQALGQGARFPWENLVPEGAQNAQGLCS